MKNILTLLLILLTISLYGCKNISKNTPQHNNDDSVETIEVIVEEPLETINDKGEDVQKNEPIEISYNQPVKQKNNVVAGNNQNYGLVATDGDWIVYANGTDSGGNSDRKLYRSDMQMKSIIKLSDDEARYVNIVNGWVYYSNLSDYGSLYKIKIDGTSRQKLLDGRSEYIFVVDDWIYFFNGSDKTELGSFLCKMKTDGTEITRLDDKIGKYISIVDDWIYYLRREAARGEIPYLLFRAKLDGSCKEQLFDGEILQVVVTGDMIYFCNIEENNNIYKMTLNGRKIEKINDDCSSDINIYRNLIYYTSPTNSDIEFEQLYRIKTDGSDKELLYDSRCFAVNISGEWVFFDNVYSDYTEQRRMRLDGSDNRLVENEKHKTTDSGEKRPEPDQHHNP